MLLVLKTIGLGVKLDAILAEAIGFAGIVRGVDACARKPKMRTQLIPLIVIQLLICTGIFVMVFL